MSNLHVSLLGKTLPGPVIAASGTFGYTWSTARSWIWACWAACAARA